MHKLSQIWIRNFRCCENITLNLETYTPLVGYNNAGKSTIIQAIIWLLGGSGGLGLEDFCQNSTAGAVEVVGKITGITKDILNRVPEKHRSRISEYITEDGILYIKRKQTQPSTSKKDRVLSVLKPEKEMEDEKSWAVNPTGIDQAIGELFPSPIHIQAMQDASQDAAKNTSSSTLGKLLKEILGIVQKEHSEEIAGAINNLSELLSAEGRRRAPELREIDESANRALGEFFPGIEIRAEIPAPTIPTLFKSGTIKTQDPMRGGSWHEFESMGHGAQRTIQMALVRCLAERGQADDNPTCRLLLIDEPELYLHPQAVEQVSFALHQLGEKGYQVVFSTHSPLLVGKSDVPNALLIRKKEHGTQVLKTMAQAAKEKIEDYMAQSEILFSLSNSSKILFCDKVVFVEGRTEERILPYFYERKWKHSLGVDKIALVAVDGAGGILKSIDIANAMGIDCQGVVDIDAVYKDCVKSQIVSKDAPEISACIEFFNQLKNSGEVELGEDGFPKKKNGCISPSDAFAKYAEEKKEELEPFLKQLRDEFKIWAWPVGDIEHVFNIKGKKEKVWARFLAQVENYGDEGKIIAPDVLNAFWDWIRSRNGE